MIMKCGEKWQRQRERGKEERTRDTVRESKSESGCLPKGTLKFGLRWGVGRVERWIVCHREAPVTAWQITAQRHIRGASKLARGVSLCFLYCSWICSGLWWGWWVVWFTGGYLWDIFVHCSIFSKEVYMCLGSSGGQVPLGGIYRWSVSFKTK